MYMTDPSSPSIQAPSRVVVIGSNTGGPQALAQMLPQLPADLPATIIVSQQMRRGFTRVLVDQLQQVCRMPVFEPDDGQSVQSSRILVAPAGSRLTIAKSAIAGFPGYTILLEQVEEHTESARTRVDAAMASAAQVFGANAVGVLLTGLGADGREGMRAIHGAGGTTIAQDQASSVVHGLPASAIDAGIVHEVLPLWSIADRIVALAGGKPNAVAA